MPVLAEIRAEKSGELSGFVRALDLAELLLRSLDIWRGPFLDCFISGSPGLNAISRLETLDHLRVNIAFLLMRIWG